MTMNQDEAIARTCGCGEFDEPIADEYWEDLTVAERWEIGKRNAMATASRAVWTPGEIKEADYVPF